MCGYGPITTLMEVARLKGDVQPKLLSYQTSGDITKDKSAVVGYAAILFSRE